MKLQPQLTQRCDICGAIREPKKIDLYMLDIGDVVSLPDAWVSLTVFYCIDNQKCLELADGLGERIREGLITPKVQPNESYAVALARLQAERCLWEASLPRRSKAAKETNKEMESAR